MKTLTTAIALLFSLAIFSQSSLELVKAENYSQGILDELEDRYLGTDGEALYFVSDAYQEKADGVKEGFYGEVIAYSMTDFQLLFQTPIEVPTVNATEISFHGGMPLIRGIGLFYSFYDKKNNQRSLAMTRISPNGKLSSEVEIISVDKAFTEKLSSEISFHYNPKGEAGVILECFPHNVSTYTVKNRIKVLKITKEGKVIAEHELNVGKKKEYYIEVVGVSPEGNLILEREFGYNEAILYVNAQTGVLNELTDLKDDIGKDYLGKTPLTVLSGSNGNTVLLESIYAPMKKDLTRTIGFRVTTFDPQGNIQYQNISLIEEDDVFPKNKPSKFRPCLRDYTFGSARIEDNAIKIAGYRYHNQNHIFSLFTHNIDLESGDITQQTCERQLISNYRYGPTRNQYFFARPDGFKLICYVPESWINQTCGNFPSYEKKEAATLDYELSMMDISNERFSPHEQLNLRGADFSSSIRVTGIVPVEGKHLIVLSPLKNSDYYFAWY